MDIVCPLPHFAPSVSSSVKWGPEQPSLHDCQRPGGRAGPADLRPHHPEIWGCAPDQGRACLWGRVKVLPLPGRTWCTPGGRDGDGAGSPLQGPHWLAGGRCSPGAGLGLPPELHLLATSPALHCAGEASRWSTPLCPVRQRPPAPDPVPAASLGRPRRHELLREGGQVEPVLRGRGFPGCLPRGGGPLPEAARPAPPPRRQPLLRLLLRVARCRQRRQRLVCR